MQSQENGGASPEVAGSSGTTSGPKTHINGGRFDFDDGGTYCGGWEDGKAHGHGVCTGPKSQGAYSGSWHYGFEVSGVYTWPSGSAFEGQWQNGKRHGLGVETRGRWLYRGDWTQGFKGRYGVRQSATSNAKYEGTWTNGLQDGHGSETYADGGTYQGQWLRGMRHGYGVRTSVPFGLASHYRPNKSVRASLTSLRSNEGATAGDTNPSIERDRRVDDSRGGFVLKAKSDPTAAPARRRSLVEKSSSNFKNMLSKMKKQRSLDGEVEKGGKAGTTASLRSTASSASWVSTESYQSGLSHQSGHTDSNASFVVEDEMMDKSVTETYMGEWKNDKRSGFGIAERSDGLKYEGEWFNNKKYGYGVTTFKDGTKEEGKYKNNVLITSQKKKHLFLIRSAKFRERIDAAVYAAQRASKLALQKADIAISRTATARGEGELADAAAAAAQEESDIALEIAKQFAPDFQQPSIHKSKGSSFFKIKANEDVSNGRNNLVHQKLTDVTSNSTPLLDGQHAQQNFVQHSQAGSAVLQPSTADEKVQGNGSGVTTDPVRMSTATLRTESSSSAIRGTNIRRNSQVAGDPPSLSFQQAMSDHFDHYKRPPSRDPSVDRMNKAGPRLALGSRQPSVDKANPPELTERTSRGPSVTRDCTPQMTMGNGTIAGTGTGPGVANAVSSPSASINAPYPALGNEARRRTPLGDVSAAAQPKRTESLFVNSTTAKAGASKAGTTLGSEEEGGGGEQNVFFLLVLPGTPN
ncbi:hypothetical protein RUM43_014862 [Polyplax serrata]|uniref:Junctophilin n=1 Tax=Polyplax serrata TaxID=468196 RepID=A0AAN8NUW1_POLSC